MTPHPSLGRTLPPRVAPGLPSLARLEIIADLLDSRWRIPGTGIRFGADALFSLLPGLGPVVSTVISGYLIWEARRLGVSTGTVLRMIGNVGLDGLISAVPVAGAVGDVFFRANRRNMALLREYLARPALWAPPTK
ncbi:DUF4112 domain-containing protein [Paracraurococcus ruber]|uniref:DUF4112 domain-containing protein n=1 Tax=Paracraurococcus ruber TaxID=77675 RepID=A0ABS1D4N4_9PROT|nr:DUF4112 domain-containing protein [Paracraurococcus ruber]MBK1661222.1 hypothetical protein [Paracraurococcus ruber]TDG25024.1 DUF4112 domain-containing protein [Paracraurococcus ruber]